MTQYPGYLTGNRGIVFSSFASEFHPVVFMLCDLRDDNTSHTACVSFFGSLRSRSG